MKKYLLLFLAACFLCHVEAQEYRIQLNQLEKLEIILQSYRQDRQKSQALQQKLKAELNSLQMESAEQQKLITNLRLLLEQERRQTLSLQKSSEQSLMSQQQEMASLHRELDKAKEKINTLKRINAALIFTAILLVLLIVLYIIIKLKT